MRGLGPPQPCDMVHPMRKCCEQIAIRYHRGAGVAFALVLLGCGGHGEPPWLFFPDLAGHGIDLAPVKDAGPPPDLAPPPDLTPVAPEDPFYCVADGGVVSPLDGGYAVQTDHYALRVEVSTAERAAELGHLAEASWAAFSDYFGTPPALAQGERLRVGYYDTQARWSAALMADGVPVPQAGGIYWTGTKTAYMYRQPTLYFTDMLFLHEMTHQFHLLARTGNQGRPGWYVEGVAEYLGRHDWDGRCLRLGRLPLLTQEDYPKTAIEYLMKSPFDLAQFIAGMMSTGRDIQLLVYRYFERAQGGRYRAAWKKFRDAVDAGAPSTLAAFMMLVGDPDGIQPLFRAWAQLEQEPMSVVFLEWTHIGPDRVRGNSPGAFSVARVKKPVARFNASWKVGQGGGGASENGVLVRYDDSTNFAAYLVAGDGTVKVYHSTMGALVYRTLQRVPVPIDGRIQAEVSFGAQTTLTINGVQFTENGAMTPAAGLAIYQSDVVFEGIGWN